MSDLTVGEDGVPRCDWGSGDPLYQQYHDDEWGRATTDDARLFEKICLEGFQAGLAWITVLRKRERFREVFAHFDIPSVGSFGDREIELLLTDAGIIRHRGKIESTINNASRALELIEEFGSIAGYVWPLAPEPTPGFKDFSDMPSKTDISTALSKDLKKRGWSFVGPTTVYAFMQAMGLVNDHLQGCHVRDACEASRVPVLARYQ